MSVYDSCDTVLDRCDAFPMRDEIGNISTNFFMCVLKLCKRESAILRALKHCYSNINISRSRSNFKNPARKLKKKACFIRICQFWSKKFNIEWHGGRRTRCYFLTPLFIYFEFQAFWLAKVAKCKQTRWLVNIICPCLLLEFERLGTKLNAKIRKILTGCIQCVLYKKKWTLSNSN